MTRTDAELFEGVLAAMPLPVYLWRRDEAGALRLAGYNPEAERWTHGAVTSLLGVAAGDLYADEPQILDELQTCLQAQRVIRRRMVYRFRTTTEVRHLAVTYAPAGPGSVMVYTVDVTEEQRAVEARQASAHLSRELLAWATRLLEADEGGLNRAVEGALAAAAQALDLTAIALARYTADGDAVLIRWEWVAPGQPAQPSRLPLARFPLLRVARSASAEGGWRWRYGQPLPPEASAADRMLLDPRHTKAAWVLPVVVAGAPEHALMLRHSEPDGLPDWAQAPLTVLARLLGAALSRALAQASLRRSEALLQGLVDTTPEALLRLDRAGRLKGMNPAARLLLAVGGPRLEALRGSFSFDAVAEAIGFDPDDDPLARPTGTTQGRERPVATLKAAMGLPTVPADEGRFVVAHFIRVREAVVDEGALRLQDVTQLRTLRARLRAAEAELAALKGG